MGRARTWRGCRGLPHAAVPPILLALSILFPVVGAPRAQPFLPLPRFLCGPGDPEGFLYRGTRNPDGTRDGDQAALIAKLAGTGANCIYMIAVRSHGGDGGPTENPFVDSDPAQGLDARILNQWEQWFAAMDRQGIVIFLFLYDDSARAWDTGDEVGPAEREFVRGLVGRFRHHTNLVWCIAEEYQEAYTPARVRSIAAEIRAADPDHPIAVHKLHGLDFSEFADEADIDQFAIQYNVPTAEELHAGCAAARREAAGRYGVILAEAAGWGTGDVARRKAWACAMGGASVMVLGMDIATTPNADLEDCGRLAGFMESAGYAELEPHDELGCAGTEYVLAASGERYVAYAGTLDGPMGLRDLPVGRYDLRWLDCATGRTTTQSVCVEARGDREFAKPEQLGPEVAVLVSRQPGR